MYLSDKASRVRQQEAQKARENRLEIVKALSHGTVSRRDLHKWGIFTATGALALKNGLSPFAKSAYAAVPTGAPPSPTFGAQPWVDKLNRLEVQAPTPLVKVPDPKDPGHYMAQWTGEYAGLEAARRLSYHTDFTNEKDATKRVYNPWTGRGPIEGRAPGEIFSHQRWDEFFPQVGYVSSWGQCADGTRFHSGLPAQDKNSVWTYGRGQLARGQLPPMLIKGRYGEPILHRIYNATAINRADNNGFGRNEQQLHHHNAHNGAESDGASGCHHFPGTFYDLRWSTTLARRDKINTLATDPRASGPDGKGGLINVPGDWREIQGTLWAHDHRFFFTAENVYKGNLMMVNYYSGRDRGNERCNDGVNIGLPSGWQQDYGNLDFDVNLIVSDAATDQNGQLIFDTFTTDGVVGDLLLVNFGYKPYMEVLPRRYRFRFLSAGMSRWIQMQLAGPNGAAVPMHFIANDGNLLVKPVPLTLMPVQGTAERFEVIVDFSKFKVGDKLHFVNVLQHNDGLKPAGTVALAQALKGVASDPAVGPALELRVVSSLASVDGPVVNTIANSCGSNDKSYDPASPLAAALTEQIPVVTPVRTRVVEFTRGPGDSRQANGECIPDCPEAMPFPWVIKINGQAAHSMNANRVGLQIPKAGEIEHWTYVNGGGGWDHPIHLHFEEGITMNRGNKPIDATELLVRKDVWRLGEAGQVTFQVQFGEYGGSYVNHCHNTVHEDFALLMRIQLMTGTDSYRQVITATPNPTPDGVFFTTPDIIPEGNPYAPHGTAKPKA